MKQIFFAGGTAGHSPGLTYYGAFYARRNTSAAFYTTTANNGSFPVAVAGTFSNFYIELGGSPGSAGTRTYTIMKNGVDTSNTFSITGANTSGSSSTQVAFNAGDFVAFKGVTSGATVSEKNVTVEFDTTTDYESMLLGQHTGFSTTTTQYGQIAAINYAQLGATASARIVFPHPGTITSLYGFMSSAPGSAKSLIFEGAINGSPISAATVSGTATSGSVTGLSHAFNAGDHFFFRLTPSGTPTSGNIQFSIGISSATAGQSVFTGVQHNVATATTQYDFYAAIGANNTEENVQAVNRYTEFTVLNWTQTSLVAPGSAKEFAFTARRNGTSTDYSATLSGTNTSFIQAAGSAVYAVGNTISLVSVPSGSPTAGTRAFSVTQFVPTGSASASRFLRGLIGSGVVPYYI